MRLRQAALPLVFLVLVAVLAPPAHGYFVLGGFSERDAPIYLRWPFRYMDTDGDGDISGPNEGIEVTFEGGEFGWTDDEIDTIMEAFDVWQNVPTSYIAFFPNPAGPIVDPMGVIANDSNDFINFIAIDLPGQPLPAGVGGGVLGLTMTTYALVDTELEWEGMIVPVSGRQFIEVDVAIDGLAVRRDPALPGIDPEFDLKAIMVHEIGHMIGMSHTPLNNLALVNGQLVEDPAVYMRDAQNQLYLAGATPSMFPVYFYTADQDGEWFSGHRDLAYDDISGVSFLYPRGRQDMFWTVKEEARTYSRRGFPSAPISGGHVVAWVDADGNPDTPRIPLFSTMTGLYQPAAETWLRGKFELRGLRKQIEDASGTLRPADYTLTINPLNGLDVERQAPQGYGPEDFDSMHAVIDPTDPRDDYVTVFPSEVFREGGNIFDMAKRNLGTPLAYSEQRGKPVSVNSGKTLGEILPGQTPMFGERTQVCPFNITTASLKSQRGNNALRAVRDTLLHSAAGVALVDTYYQAAPALAAVLTRHTSLLRGVDAMTRLFEWALVNYWMLLATAGGALAFALVLVLRLRKAAGVAGLALLLAVGLCVPAGASVRYMTTSDMVSMADDIVTGTVENVDSYWATDTGRDRIMTDVAIRVSDSVKGGRPKDGLVHLTLPGGRVGDIVTETDELPTFRVGERILLYLTVREGYGYLVVGGKRGKLGVKVDPKSGVEYVFADSMEAALGLRESTKALALDDKDDGVSGRVPLAAYTEYLHGIVARQAYEEESR